MDRYGVRANNFNGLLEYHFGLTREDFGYLGRDDIPSRVYMCGYIAFHQGAPIYPPEFETEMWNQPELIDIGRQGFDDARGDWGGLPNPCADV